MNVPVLSVVVAGAGIGAAIDLVHRRIPNAVVAATASAGLLLSVTGLSEISPWSSLLGLAGGLLLMLPGYALAGTGAGDVKLFAAVGAVLGAGRIVDAFLATLIAGGVVALIFAVMRRQMTGAFPYGPAIAAGSVVAAVMP